jgi:CheY-like chemotaxis protein
MPLGKILCIDDEVVGLRVRKLMLESEGFEVTIAVDGKSALELCAQLSFDLVLLDYSMPGMNGGEVALAMRRLRPEIPIILLSAYITLPEEHIQLVDGHVTKGESTEALLTLIRKLIDRKTDHPDSKEPRTA